MPKNFETSDKKDVFLLKYKYFKYLYVINFINFINLYYFILFKKNLKIKNNLNNMLFISEKYL